MDLFCAPVRWVGVFRRQVVDMAKKKKQTKKDCSGRPVNKPWVDEINKALAGIEIFIPDDPKLSPEIRVDQDQEDKI
jgi:hypothetical protein